MLGADWGEREPAQGAAESTGELQVEGWSSVPKEHSLTQQRMTDFLNPAAAPEATIGVPEWPTQHNERSNIGTARCSTDPGTYESSGGSPCGADQSIVEGGNTKNESLYDDNSSKRPGEDLVDLEDSPGVAGGNPILTGESEAKNPTILVEPGGTVTPSGKIGVKQNGMEGEGNTKTTFDGSNQNGNIDSNVCEFKRGGMCKKHGVKGSRTVKSTKVWNKRKDGTFAWVWKKQTIYTCAVEPDSRERPSPTSGMVTESDISTLGVGNQTKGATCEVFSGVVTRAGANLDRTEHEQKINRKSNEDL